MIALKVGNGLKVMDVPVTSATRIPPAEVQVGDVAQMRKPHACGGFVWTVYRIGADIGLTCATCGRHVFLARTVFNKRVKQLNRTPSL